MLAHSWTVSCIVLGKGQGLLWVATFKQLCRLIRGEILAVGGTPLVSNWNDPLATRVPADVRTPPGICICRFNPANYSVPFGFWKVLQPPPASFPESGGLVSGMTILP